MIIYIDDWKLVYNDYTLYDAINLVCSYAGNEGKKNWKIFGLDGELLAESDFK